ncbi:MAG TPA: sialate O-acetylesterase [Bacteroidota bacterium]|nr:sialate O-acetylesterase [Bacteroidota bacterium]
MRSTLLITLVLALAHAAFAGGSSLRLAPLFTDGMVLQQRSVVPVWGKGTPGTAIAVSASWRGRWVATVNEGGTWEARITTPGAGGPFEVRVASPDSTVTLRNVLAGEVWLCSGQSNMEMPLEGWATDTVLDARAEIAHSTDSAMRLFTVKRAYAADPQESCAGNWVECSPATSPLFSAAAYFFGRDLRHALGVPVGLILSSWGGTKIESWISAPALARVPQYDSTIAMISVTRESLKVLGAWLRTFPVIDMSTRDPHTRWQNLPLADGACASPAFPDSLWHTMRLPTYWERTEVGEFDGVVWFRRHVTIPRSWLHRDLVLELGPVDDIDVTYVNGKQVGAHEAEGAWNLPRVYTVPKDLVDTTAMTLAVRVIDYGGGGGIWGGASSMRIHPSGGDDSVALAGDWRYLPVADYVGDRLYLFGIRDGEYFRRPHLPYDFSGYSPTALYNGMVAPLAPYGLAGVIWYQGESNADAPRMYRTLFPLMIGDWRGAFRSPGMPFYFVQIAPYPYGTAIRSEFLREAQFMTLGVKNTGMAVTLDIGDTRDIHPANKQEVGRRLALWALARHYGKPLTYSGPLYRSRTIRGNTVVLAFDHADGGLVVTQSRTGSGFLIAGEDRVFRPARATVRGSTLVVSSPYVTRPAAVRYAFTNEGEATFFNGAGLPSPSFRTDDWEH